MNIHKNARLTPRGRERIVRQVASGQTREAVAEAVGDACHALIGAGALDRPDELGSVSGGLWTECAGFASFSS